MLELCWQGADHGKERFIEPDCIKIRNNIEEVYCDVVVKLSGNIAVHALVVVIVARNCEVSTVHQAKTALICIEMYC